MSIVARIQSFTDLARKLMCMFIAVPLFAAGVPVMLSKLPPAYEAYRGLSERGVETDAQIRDLVRTGGRVERVIAVSSFLAANGRRYTASPSFYPSETYRMRPGHTIKIIYDRANPSNNALSTASARRQIWANIFGALFAAGGFAILVWIFRNDYRMLWTRKSKVATQSA